MTESAPPGERSRGLEELFDAAVGLPREERVAFLDRACGSDQQLRAEVEAGREEAIDILARLLTMNYADPLTPAVLRLDPVWDPLRDHPRFQALVR